MSGSNALSHIEKNIGTANLASSCSRDGCRVFLTGIPSPRAIADIDRAFPAQKMEGKRCDFVLFFKGGKDVLFSVPMELKSGDVDASKVVVQLQAGAEFVDRVARNFSNSTCRPILFHGGRLHRKQRGELNRAKVRFRGQALTISTARCGRHDNLAEALSLKKKR